MKDKIRNLQATIRAKKLAEAAIKQILIRKFEIEKEKMQK